MAPVASSIHPGTQAGEAAWLALSALILLSYLPKIAGVPLMPWVFLAIWVPFLLLLVLGKGWDSGDGNREGSREGREA